MSKNHPKEKFVKYGRVPRGPSIKDVCTRGGRGVCLKRSHSDAGGGGSVAKGGRPQIQIFPIFSKFKKCSVHVC